MLDQLVAQPPDPILSLIAMYRDDPRADKIDLGVGVYRDAAGGTPVFAAVKAAERLLVEQQGTKAYLGAEGNLAFLELLRPIVLGDLALASRLVALQTPGGSGALRLAAEVGARASRTGRIWVGDPTWPIHRSFFSGARLEVVPFEYYSVADRHVRFDCIRDSIVAARAGDMILLHGCCHNPTGADLDRSQWDELARLLADSPVVPLLDLAYQGLGDGVEDDAYGVRAILRSVPEALLAYSCDKNFGLYRERTGAIFAVAGNAEGAQRLHSNLCDIARGNWSMPPDHGAAIVAAILQSPELRQQWLAELASMRQRLSGIRGELARHGTVGGVDLAAIGGQRGLFSQLALARPRIDALRRDHGVYMTGAGRINVSGLTSATVSWLVGLLAQS